MQGSELKTLRLRLKLKQHEMANTLGISRSTYMRYEHGKWAIKKSVEKLAEVMREQSTPPN